MGLNYVSVFAFDIEIDQVVRDLQDHGVVVVITSRPEATRIANDASLKLGIGETYKDGQPFLNHLSFQGDDGSWDDCLVYSKKANYTPARLKDLTILSVREWRSAGERDYYVYKWRA